MRVALVHDQREAVGGAERYVAALRRGLEALGHRTTFYGPGDGPIEPCDLVHVHGAPSALNLPRMCATLPRETAIVVTAHDLRYACPGGARLLRQSGRICTIRFGAPCLLRAYTEHCAPRRPRVLIKELMSRVGARRIGHRVARWHTASTWVRDELVRAGFSEERIAVLPLPLLMTHTATPAAKRQGFLFVGRLVDEKGLAVLLGALAHVPEAALIVAGDGPKRAGYEEMARKLRLTDRVQFLGWLDEGGLSGRYAAASALVVPSVWPEPFGLVGPEALAHATPVIASKIGGIPEWSHPDDTWLVPPGDERALAERMDWVIRHRAASERAGQHGRERVQRDFALGPHIERIEQLYSQVVEARERA